MFCHTGSQREGHGAQRLRVQTSVPCWWGAGWLLLLAAWVPAFGQVSVLDTSFKVGPGANKAVDAIVVQADQRILVGGEFTAIAGCSNSYLARLSADGTVDKAFNPAGQTDGPVQCLLQQPDRKVLVGGSFGRLLGQDRPALVRLQEDGSVDTTFDASALFSTNTWVFSLALQADGRLLVGYTGVDNLESRIVRVNTNGSPDPAFVCTNQFAGYVMVLFPQPDGSVLFGGSIWSVGGVNSSTLLRLKPDGALDETFDAGLESSSVFCLARLPGGQILAGGFLKRTGASNGVPLLRLNADLSWDESFKPDAFGAGAAYVGPSLSALLLQTDGQIVVGGDFFEVSGYWRRQIIRLTAEGHVDGCFDPGLGLGGGGEPGPVRAIVQQSDGRVLIGGQFHGMDTALGQFNLARLLPKSDRDLMRVYLNDRFAAATFPPGGTNSLDWSEDLKNWRTLDTSTSPYIYYSNISLTNPPRAFLRARQER